MKTFKTIMLSATLLAASLALLTGCGSDDVVKKAAGSDVTIVYTNDVHSCIENVVEDEDGNVIGPGLRFSKIAAMVSDMREAGANVLLVDGGDEIAGDIYGAMDQGETIIDIMKATGYQLAAPGNHEFDYGLDHFLELAKKAEFPYVLCNFHTSDSDETVFPSYEILEAGDKKIAFIGVITPDAMESSTPAFFQNEAGEFLYDIDGLANTADFYDTVQQNIDEVRDQADYVIAIGHVGVAAAETEKGWDSRSLIANVSGLDAFIDGNSHTVMEGETVKDKDGNKVILTQTGSKLDNVGIMTISKSGKISTTLLEDYEKSDQSIAAMEKDWMYEVGLQMDEKIGELEMPLYIKDPSDDDVRLVRSQEVNMGDFVADSIYWFFNERIGLDCDAVIQNGGGIREGMEEGDLTYYSAKQVSPFGDMVCMINATGQEILDALEMGAMVSGEWDDEWNSPAEVGGFMQVAGIKYTIDATVPSSVTVDKNGMFKSVDGDYRVRNVQIYNRERGIYEDLDLEKKYTLGGINYVLRNGGNGLTMFSSEDYAVDCVGLDYVVLAEYIKSFGGDGEYPLVNTDNSPLASYKGYLIDYDSPYGAGRIVVRK